MMVRSKILLGMSALAYAGTAQAQTAPVGSEAPARAEAATGQAADEGDIVVSGIRQSLERAAQIKQNAAQVVDSIVSEDIGKFPDPTTAAALQRVPGVQVSVTQSNEIGNVRVRGLGDILTTVDGREIITTTGRTFAMQDLPADALARVDVIKSNTSDLIEGGIAGIIDLQLNKPFNFRKPTLVVNARGNYGLKSDKFDPQVSVLATDTWQTGIGDIGALVNVSWAKTHYNHPRTREGVRRAMTGTNIPYTLAGAMLPNVVESHSDYGWYERPQANAALQWQASDHLQVYADGLYTGYRSQSQWSLANAQLFLPGTTISNVQLSDDCIAARSRLDSGQSPLPGGTPPTLPAYRVSDLCQVQSATISNAVSEQKTYSYNNRTDAWLGAFGFKYDDDIVHAKAEVSYQRSVNTSETILAVVGQRIPTFEYTANNGDGAVVTTPGDPFLSSANVVLSEGMDQTFSRSVGDLFQARIDGSFDIDSGLLSKFQSGFRYADRGGDLQQAVVSKSAPGGVIGSGTEATAIKVDASGLPAGYLYRMPGVPTFNGGAGALVPNPDFLRSDEGRDILRTLYGLPTGDPDYQPQRAFYANEKTLAGYAQLSYETPIAAGITLDGVVGVRPTRTERSIRGSSVVTIPAVGGQPARTEIRPLTANTSDTDVLPNASARLQFGGGLQLRTSYSKTIRRPDFASLNPGLTYSLSTNPNILNAGSAGNPDLRPQKSDSYDVSLEYYFRRGFIAVAGYKRDITDRVVTASANEVIDGINYSISRPRNVGQAELKGVEVSGQAFFDFLPGLFSGLGVMGNFTYADTQVKGSDRLTGLPLQGVSKYNFNAGLLYEKSGLSGRLVYTYRSEYYDSDETGALGIREVDPARASDATYNPLLLNYVRPSGRLDFGLSWDMSDRIRFDLGGTNILGAKYRGYYNQPAFGQEYRYDDTTYTAGVRIRI
ncbi:TonB-dependent receptor [Sphingomonas sp. MMS12-HWE2-04]|uniref:TonB-dependent receptor n=1 Tax=Sphingomonas sp. MMS12-HWE2-04 TaxID=3234199 RepID=UPI00384D8C70